MGMSPGKEGTEASFVRRDRFCAHHRPFPSRGPAMAHLAQLLYATLDANPSVRAQGEAGLASGAMQPGFGLALAQVCTSPEYAYGIRQLAGLVLRKYVKVRRRVGRVAGSPLPAAPGSCD